MWPHTVRSRARRGDPPMAHASACARGAIDALQSIGRDEVAELPYPGPHSFRELGALARRRDRLRGARLFGHDGRQRIGREQQQPACRRHRRQCDAERATAGDGARRSTAARPRRAGPRDQLRCTHERPRRRRSGGEQRHHARDLRARARTMPSAFAAPSMHHLPTGDCVRVAEVGRSHVLLDVAEPAPTRLPPG